MTIIRVHLTLLMAMLCLSFAAVAQDADDDSKDSGDETEAAEAQEDSFTASAPEGGDVLVLKTGDRIEGFQILRSTHQYYILEGFYDPETDETVEIKVSRGQVAEVIEDEIDPMKAREEAKKLAMQRTQTTVEGARLTDRLYGLLEKVIGDPPLVTDGLNLAQMLDEVNKRVDNVLEIDPAVREPQRPWKGAVPPEMTLAKFLETQITPNYPALEVVFQENGVQIKPKAAPAAPGGAPTPPPPPIAGGRAGIPGGAAAGGPPPAVLFPGARGGNPQ